MLALDLILKYSKQLFSRKKAYRDEPSYHIRRFPHLRLTLVGPLHINTCMYYDLVVGQLSNHNIIGSVKISQFH